MSEVTLPHGKITINFSPIVVRSIKNDITNEVKCRAGGYNTWVDVPHDFTVDRISEIFDVQLPWLKDLDTGKVIESNTYSRKEIRVPSSDGKKFYTVTQDALGKVYCTCSGFGFRSKCKHLDMIHNPNNIPKQKDEVRIFDEASFTNPIPKRPKEKDNAISIFI
jgi:hypothetical protein